MIYQFIDENKDIFGLRWLLDISISHLMPITIIEKTIRPDTKSRNRKYMKKSKVFTIAIIGSLVTVE